MNADHHTQLRMRASNHSRPSKNNKWEAQEFNPSLAGYSLRNSGGMSFRGVGYFPSKTSEERPPFPIKSPRRHPPCRRRSCSRGASSTHGCACRQRRLFSLGRGSADTRTNETRRRPLECFRVHCLLCAVAILAGWPNSSIRKFP